ncbi:MAG: PilZ domain-containing protein [Candidatus Methylomirabilales bacterium]
MSTHPTMAGYPRFEAYMPVLCAAPTPGWPLPTQFAGRTQCVSAGGLALLLPKRLPLSTPVSVRVWQGDPLRGIIVSVGRGTRTDMRIIFPHGMAFEKPVDPALVRQWLSQAKPHPEARVPVRFGVECTQAGVAARGTCVNLSRGGMFVAISHPAPPGTELMLHFALPTVPDALSVPATVVWMREGEGGPSVVGGMGVQFLDPGPSEVALIGTLVDRLRGEASPLPESPPDRAPL